jgi:hypothetical protein
MIELGFLITLLELAAAVAPEFRERVPFNPVWLIVAAALFQFFAWIGRFILQPKLEARLNADKQDSSDGSR